MNDFWETHLHPGETLLWQGAPIPSFQLKFEEIFVAAIGLFIAFFGLSMFVASLEYFNLAEIWGEFIWPIVGIVAAFPIAGFGLFLIFECTYAEVMQRRSTRYALSNRSAYIASNWRTFTINSYPILPGTTIGLRQGKRWSRVSFYVRTTKGEEDDIVTTIISFERIADGPKVFRLIRGIQMDTP